MFLTIQIRSYIMTIYKKLAKTVDLLSTAEAIVIGAGSGLSAAAGITYSGPRFEELFDDFISHYHFSDMYSAGFYPFDSLEEYWAYWSKHIYYNRYALEIGQPYKDLLKLLKKNNYFVITTNVDHQFQKAGFDKERLFYTQGDYGLFQCSKACHKKTYENESIINKMVEYQQDFKIPSWLVPHCPKCGEPFAVDLRVDQYFVEDNGWQQAQKRYQNFLEENKGKEILFLELGVGYNTPVIIKYPFWKMTYQNDKASYVYFNQEQLVVPDEIKEQTIDLQGDIRQILEKIVNL